MTTVSDIKPPEYNDTDLDLLWIIANRVEGNVITEVIGDITPHPQCWATHTIFLYIIANEGADGGGIVLADYPYQEYWSKELKLWYLIANNLQGNATAIDLTDVPQDENLSTRLQLIYIIAQEGATAPLDIANITDDPCWSTETQLYYIIASNGLVSGPTTQGLELWHKYLSTEGHDTLIEDFSDNTNRGTLYSGAGVELDGVNDEIAFTSPFNFQDGTLFITFTPQTTNTGAGEALVASASPGYSYMFWLQINMNLVRFWTQNSDGFTLNYSFTVGQTYMIAMVKDGANCHMYVNGVFVSTGTTSSATSYFKLEVIGHYRSSNYTTGRFGGFKIMSHKCSAAEVLDLYNYPEKILPDGVTSDKLDMYLPMTEGVGTTCNDGSGNGNAGTINGGVWATQCQYPYLQTALVDWNEGGGGETLVVSADGNDITGVAIANPKFENSINLDGKSKVLISAHNSIQQLNTWSIEFWVKIKKDKKNPLYWTGATTNRCEIGTNVTRKVYYDYSYDLPASSHSFASLDQGQDILHIALVVGAQPLTNEVNMYINTVLVDTVTPFHSAYPNWHYSDYSWKIGTNEIDNFFGEIMAMRVYQSTYLTPAKVKDNYNAECQTYGLAQIP